jgi:hypothetical protein
MAQQAGDQGTTQEQYNLVYTLGVQAGIKRDGTKFESRDYQDGVWCRFQRGTPKKMGGYREIFSTFSGILRGMIANAYNGVNYIFAGTANTLDVFTTGTTYSAGSGPYQVIFTPGYSALPVYSNTTTTFKIRSYASTPTSYASVYPAGTKVIFTQAGTPTVYTTVGTPTFSTPDTTVTVTGGTIVGSPTTVWIDNYNFTPDDRNLWQFDLQYNPSGGALEVIAHPGLNLANIDNGVPTQVQYGSVLPNSSVQWTFTGLADTAGQNPTYKPIVVDGGVCVLYPYLFVFGSNGFIANNHVDSTLANYFANSLSDWNGATANQINMASSKIVKGAPVRGGTNAPSGLFWATDSLIRVSFTGAAPLYWRYDIISSQISIMSSSAVVEMDGIYYWMGVDRFYLYNGSVNVLPNDKNVNWLFDNLNYEQRQKVWATKVPRYNEIWFFYPRGSATECTDAIIYNVKDKIWYDAGSAEGAQRSCGYTTEIFPSPIWADWNYGAVYSQPFTISSRPASLPAPTTKQIYVAGDVTGTFSPGDYLSFSTVPQDTTYRIVTSTFTFNSTIRPLYPKGVTLITCDVAFNPVATVGGLVYYITGGYPIWQHEYGLNKVSFSGETSILSSFTTCDISWVGGTPSQDTSSGANRRMHLRRVEPDFVQGGEMVLSVLGRKFARGDTTVVTPFPFGPETGKIDMRVENRETTLKFSSDTIDGNYEMGRLLITAEYGDERP